MLKYQNNTKQFVEDVRQNVIADIMSSSFKERWSRKNLARQKWHLAKFALKSSRI